EQQAWAPIVFIEPSVEACTQHIGADHHAGAAAGRCIVDGSMPAKAMRADIARVRGPNAARQSLAGERETERTRKYLFLERQKNCLAAAGTRDFQNITATEIQDSDDSAKCLASFRECHKSNQIGKVE